MATVACLRQYLDGSIARPGLWLMGHAVDPARLLADLAALGAAVTLSAAAAQQAI